MRVLAEDAAIIVSILLAFAIQAWWDGAQDRAEERRVLQALRREFESNRLDLEELINNHHAWRASLNSFYATPLEQLLALDADSLVDEVVAGFRMGITYDPSVGALETLISGGRIGLLQSADLEATLWSWQRQFADSQEEAAFIIGTVEESMSLTVAAGVMEPRNEFQSSGRTAVERLWSSDALASQSVVLEVWRATYIGELWNLLALTDSVLELIGRGQ